MSGSRRGFSDHGAISIGVGRSVPHTEARGLLVLERKMKSQHGKGICPRPLDGE